MTDTTIAAGARASEASPVATRVAGIAGAKIAGAAAIAFAVSVAIQNAVLGAGAPPFDAPLGQVLSYYADERSALAISSALVAVNLPLLLVFLTSLHSLVLRRGAAAGNWSRLAVAAGGVLAATFALVAALQVTLLALAAGLGEPTPAFELAWRLHASAFALVLPTLGTTLASAALAAHAGGLTPPWQRVLGVGGGALLLAAGLGNVAIVEGSALLYVGFAGFGAWLVWLVATGVRLVRG